MTLDQRIRLILDGPLATFARGGGGAKSSKGKAGGKKKAKGLGQGSAKGGKCCKTKDGKFAPGNNYGSKGGGSGGSLKAGGAAGQRAIGALVARTRAAQAAAGAAKQARAAKTAAATPARETAIRRMASRSQSTTLAGATVKAQREVAKMKAAQAPPKASGRGTPERAQIARLMKADRDARQKLKVLGPAPPKPSSESRHFGKRGREGASPADRARYDAEAKAYNAYNRKYSKLKKAEVEASNALYYARQSTGIPARPTRAISDEGLSSRSRRRYASTVAGIRSDKQMTRAQKAESIREARSRLRGSDPKQQARIAEQRARAERRRAQQPRLPFERASALKTLTRKSREAATKAGAAARPKGPAKDDDVLGAILSVKAERSGRYAKLTPAQRAAHAAADRQTPDVADLGFAKHGKVPIHEIRKAVAAKFGPEAAGPALDKQLFKLEAEGKIRLVAIGDRARATSQQLRESIPGVRETFFLVEPVAGASRSSGRGTPERAAAAAALRTIRARDAAAKASRKADDLRSARRLVGERQLRMSRSQVRAASTKQAVEKAMGKGSYEKLVGGAKAASVEAARVAASKSARAGRSTMIGRITGRSKAAAERAGAVAKGPVTAENIAARGRAARKAQARDVAKSAANRPARTDADRAAVQAARAAMRAKSAAEVAARPKTTPVQTVPHRVGSVPRRDVAGQVARAAEKADAARTARAVAVRKASGRGTPERAAKAAALRAERRAVVSGRKAAINRIVDKSKLTSEVKKADVRLRAAKAARVAAGLPATPPPAVIPTRTKGRAPTKAQIARADAARKQAAWDATRAKAEPKLSARARKQIEQKRINSERALKARQEVRSNREERVGNVLSRVGEVIGKAKGRSKRSGRQPRDLERDPRGRMTPEVAQRRAEAAVRLKRARAVAAKLDKDQRAKLAEQRERARRRRARQPRLVGFSRRASS